MLGILDCARQVEDRDQMASLLTKVKSLLPLNSLHVSVAALDATARVTGSSQAINLNFPLSWLAHYRTQSLMKQDPAAGLLFQAQAPVMWADLRAHDSSASARQFYYEASEFGLAEGFSFGSRFSDGRSGSLFTCVGGELAHRQRHRVLVNYLAPFLHEAFGKATTTFAAVAPALTAREIEVLKWLRVGKNDQEVAAMLGTSRRTIKFHVENLMRKLQSRNRTEAVARALSMRLIALD